MVVRVSTRLTIAFHARAINIAKVADVKIVPPVRRISLNYDKVESDYINFDKYRYGNITDTLMLSFSTICA